MSNRIRLFMTCCLVVFASRVSAQNCEPLTVNSAAKLMAPGASSANVGSFSLQQRSRQADPVTGVGPWSPYQEIYSGPIRFETGVQTDFAPYNGPYIAMTMAGAMGDAKNFYYNTFYISNTGIHAVFWEDQPDGTIEDDIHTDSTVGLISFEYQRATIQQTNCAFSAESAPTKFGLPENTENQYLLEGTFDQR